MTRVISVPDALRSLAAFSVTVQVLARSKRLTSVSKATSNHPISALNVTQIVLSANMLAQNARNVKQKLNILTKLSKNAFLVLRLLRTAVSALSSAVFRILNVMFATLDFSRKTKNASVVPPSYLLVLSALRWVPLQGATNAMRLATLISLRRTV